MLVNMKNIVLNNLEEDVCLKFYSLWSISRQVSLPFLFVFCYNIECTRKVIFFVFFIAKYSPLKFLSFFKYTNGFHVINRNSMLLNKMIYKVYIFLKLYSSIININVAKHFTIIILFDTLQAYSTFILT